MTTANSNIATNTSNIATNTADIANINLDFTTLNGWKSRVQSILPNVSMPELGASGSYISNLL